MPAGPPKPVDPEERVDVAGQLIGLGEAGAAAAAYVQAASRYFELDASDAALDACQRAIALAPGSPGAHLELVRVYLDRGWREPAAEKLVLLDRLLVLDEDPAGRVRAAEMARGAFPGDPRFAVMTGA